jgi:uncharacterized protein
MENNKNPKNILYWVAAGALAIGALSVLWYVSAYARTTRPESAWNTFTVSATGDAVGIPDVGEISFSVNTESGRELSTAQEENTKKMNEITAFLKEAGVSEEDIQTTSYNISPRYQYFPCTGASCRPAETVGYTISQTVRVKLRDLGKSGEVISGAVSRGANGVTGPNFVVDDTTAVEDEARAEAIEKAQKKAKTIAEQSGFRLGKLINISEGGDVGMPYYESKGMDMAMGAAAQSAPTPNFQPGSQEVNVSVSLTYSIR